MPKKIWPNFSPAQKKLYCRLKMARKSNKKEPSLLKHKKSLLNSTNSLSYHVSLPCWTFLTWDFPKPLCPNNLYKHLPFLLCKSFTGQTPLWSLEFAILDNVQSQQMSHSCCYRGNLVSEIHITYGAVQTSCDHWNCNPYKTQQHHGSFKLSSMLMYQRSDQLLLFRGSEIRYCKSI